MHEGKLRILESDVWTFPQSVNRSEDGIDKYSLRCVRNPTDNPDGQRAHQIGKVWKAHGSWRGISPLRTIWLLCRCSIMEHISLHSFKLFVMQRFLWQCPDALDILGIKDVCIKTGAIPFANILTSHRESCRSCGKPFMQMWFILIWKNKMNCQLNVLFVIWHCF